MPPLFRCHHVNFSTPPLRGRQLRQRPFYISVMLMQTVARTYPTTGSVTMS